MAGVVAEEVASELVLEATVVPGPSTVDTSARHARCPLHWLPHCAHNNPPLVREGVEKKCF